MGKAEGSVDEVSAEEARRVRWEVGLPTVYAHRSPLSVEKQASGASSHVCGRKRGQTSGSGRIASIRPWHRSCTWCPFQLPVPVIPLINGRPVSTFSASRKSLASPETSLWSAHGRVDQSSPALVCARLMSSSEDFPFRFVYGQHPTLPGSVPFGVGVRGGWRFATRLLVVVRLTLKRVIAQFNTHAFMHIGRIWIYETLHVCNRAAIREPKTTRTIGNNKLPLRIVTNHTERAF